MGILQIKNVSKSYGEMVVLIKRCGGRGICSSWVSGTGKTTLINLMAAGTAYHRHLQGRADHGTGRERGVIFKAIR
jgi:ABC-type taurine transport system ATPase subunit